MPSGMSFDQSSGRLAMTAPDPGNGDRAALPDTHGPVCTLT